MTAPASRREQLLSAAATLFAERGYHAVGIDAIGAAAGISGPGVYRHFARKSALLEALCDRTMTRMLDGARRLRAGTDDDAAALASLVDLHAAFSVRHRALLGVWLREQRALSEDVRRSLRRRQRAYEAVWRSAVGPLRPDLEDGEVAVLVQAALALLNSTALSSWTVPADRLEQLLRSAALRVLLPEA